jgi:hypothetical protein
MTGGQRHTIWAMSAYFPQMPAASLAVVPEPDNLRVPSVLSGLVRSKFRDARPAAQQSQAGPVTTCKLCDPSVFGIHQLLRIIDMVKPNDMAQFVHDYGAYQKGTVWPLHDLCESWGIQRHLSSDQHCGTPGRRDLPAAAISGNIAFQTRTLPGRGPRNQDRRPPIAVTVSLVRLALFTGALRGQPVVHEPQSCCS